LIEGGSGGLWIRQTSRRYPARTGQCPTRPQLWVRTGPPVKHLVRNNRSGFLPDEKPGEMGSLGPATPPLSTGRHDDRARTGGLRAGRSEVAPHHRRDDRVMRRGRLGDRLGDLPGAGRGGEGGFRASRASPPSGSSAASSAWPGLSPWPSLPPCCPVPAARMSISGEAYGKLPAFLFGWTEFLIIRAGSVATLAAAFAIYASQPQMFPAPKGWELRLWQMILAVGAMTVVAVINVIGTRASGSVQVVGTVLKLGALGAMMVLAVRARQVRTRRTSRPSGPRPMIAACSRASWRRSSRSCGPTTDG